LDFRERIKSGFIWAGKVRGEMCSFCIGWGKSVKSAMGRRK